MSQLFTVDTGMPSDGMGFLAKREDAGLTESNPYYPLVFIFQRCQYRKLRY